MTRSSSQPASPTHSTVPRLIVSDLDGTFLSPDGSVSEINATAVRAAQAAGIPVLFATGRPARWLEVIQDLPGSHPLVIASNGAVLYDQATSTALERVCLDPDATLRAIAGIRGALPDAAFALEAGDRFGREESYVPLVRDDENNPAVYSDTAEAMAAAGGQVKMLVQHPWLTSDELLDAVRTVVGDSLTATHSAVTRPGLRESGLVEISAAGVSKASMLARWCEGRGIAARDVAAFGDMPNDVDMLTWVGMPYAVANAHPLLLGAYPVVPSCSESGVGRTILGWLS
jgi:Cof subfamily protein (haloacid dehalogenase superfamily)